MNICIVGEVANCGFYLAQGLSELGHQVNILIDSQHDTSGLRFSHEDLPNVIVKWLKPKLFKTPRALGLFYSIFSEIRKIKPDIIHVNYLWSSCFSAQIAALVYNVPIVGEGHGWDVLIVPHSIIRGKIQRFFLNFFPMDKIILTADYYIDEFNSVALDNKIFIDRAIDANFFRPNIDCSEIIEKYGENIITFIARLDKQKSPYTVLHSLRIITDKIPSVKLLIIGKGPEEHGMRKLIKKINLEANTVFLGELPNHKIPKYLNASKVEVHGFVPRVKEIGISQLESLACCTPCIASYPPNDIPGVVHAVKPKEIADNVLKLLTDKNYQCILGKQGREYVLKNRSVRNRSLKMLSVYKNIYQR